MCLTETWLDKNTDNAVLVESSPSHFNFVSETQQNRSGGDVCAIFRDNILTHKFSFGFFSSFEYVPFKIDIKQSSILYITIYKPPHNCFKDDLMNCLQLCALILTVQS